MTVVTTRGHAQRGRGDVDALVACDLFATTARTDLTRLARITEVRHVRGGTVLIEDGDRADAAFIVVTGRLHAFTVTGGSERPLGDVGPGEIVGELALVSDVPRTASVRAVRDTQVLRIPAAAFRRLVRQHPDVLLRVSAVLASRVASRATTKHEPSVDVRTIAIVPAGGSRVPLTRVAAELARELSEHGRTHIVSPGTVGEVGRRTTSRAVLARLDAIEADHRFVVYVADHGATDWTRLCVRQADKVLLVGRGGGDARVSAAERAQTSSVAHELVLLWDEGSTPVDTAWWLAQRDVAAHHHVRSRVDHARVARRIAGRGIGLVLGGGGAAGFAHLGALRAFEDRGIPIDAIGGTSIGAILGATAAIGWDHPTRVERVVDAFIGTRFLVGPTLPLVSFSSSKKVTRNLHRHLGDTLIEDLPIPFFAVSANLTTDEMVVHTRGPAWLACRASASLPGVMPPVCMDGDLLVDGGVISNLPTGQMHERLPGRVIAVDVRPRIDLKVSHGFDPTLSGWRALGRKLNPFRPSMDIPGPMRVLMRAKEIGGRRAELAAMAARPADLLISMPTGGVDTLDFKGGRRLIDVGYHAAIEQIDASGFDVENAHVH